MARELPFIHHDFCGDCPGPPPVGLSWELTTGCNLELCPLPRQRLTELMSPDDLSTSECLRIVHDLAQYAPFILVLSGGEPLRRRDVFEIASRADQHGIRVALATNGTLVDEAMADRIKESGIVRVAISLERRPRYA